MAELIKRLNRKFNNKKFKGSIDNITIEDGLIAQYEYGGADFLLLNNAIGDNTKNKSYIPIELQKKYSRFTWANAKLRKDIKITLNEGTGSYVPFL